MLGLRWGKWLSLVAVNGGYSLLQCVDLTHCGAWALEHSSCRVQAQLSRGMYDLPGPGIILVSLAWSDGFFTTEPSEKPSSVP